MSTTLTLADAKSQLNISGTQGDADLQVYCDAADDVIESMIGAVVNRSVSEPTSMQDYFLRLLTRPVVSIQSLVSVADATATYDVTQLYVKNAIAGMVCRKDGGPILGAPGVSPGAWQSQYTATYTAGRGTSPPAAVNLAARIIVAHMWESTRGPAQRPTASGGDDLALITGLGYSIPNRALELLQPFRLPTGFY